MKRDLESTYSFLSLAFRNFTDRLPGGCAGELATDLDGILWKAAFDLSDESQGSVAPLREDKSNE